MKSVVIDGYNLIFKMFSKCRDLQKMREDLIEKLKKYSAYKKDHNFYLIFDGKEKKERQLRISDNLFIIFTVKEKIADDWLIKFSYMNNENLIVVSSDKKVFSKAQNHHSISLFSEEFLAILKSFLEKEEFHYVFRNKKNESKREQILRELL
jgi:predicted RNA-binding protein with PIN domain